MPTDFPSLVAAELTRARAAHPAPHSSAHEGYAVILEELDEFWAEVKKRKPDPALMLAELVQVAAMCQRCAEDVILPMLPADPADLALASTRPKKAPTSDVQRFIEWWCWGFHQFRGVPYNAAWSREAPIVAGLLKTYGLARLKQMAMVLWHDTKDEWIAGTDRGIGILRSKSNLIADWIGQIERKTGHPMKAAPEPDAPRPA